MTARKTILAVAMVFVVMRAAGTQAATTVAIWGETDSRLADVRSKIMGAGTFGAVDTVNIRTQPVPTLAEAQAYDSILIFGGNSNWYGAVSEAAGNVLADYADAGGGVVTATFVLGSNGGGWILGGRFDGARYHVMVPVSSQISGRQYLGTLVQPDHPLLSGVTSFDGGSASYRVPITALTPESTRIADWTDGQPLVAVKVLPGMGRRVDLNFYPPSSDERSDFWETDTDGNVLLANAVLWAAIPEPPSGVGASVFLSPVTAVGGGAVLANPELTVQVGETVTLGLWVSAPEGLDVKWIALDLVETGGILTAEGVAVMEGGPVPRWYTIVDPNLNDSAEDLLTGSSAVAGVGGTVGLTGNATFRTFDANFDPAAGDGNGAFLYAIIEFTATTLGDTDLYLKVGGQTIVYDPTDDTAIYFGVGDDPVWRTKAGEMSSLPDATIHVVPEPATLSLLCLGAGVVMRRRRRNRFC